MSTKTRVCVALLGGALSCVLAFWFWPRKASRHPVDQEGLAELTTALRTLLTPPTVTGEDMAAVKWFADQSSAAEGVNYAAITGLRPLLELDTNGTARHMLAMNRWGPGRTAVTELWSHKAGRSVTIDWASKRVSLSGRSSSKSGLTFAECRRTDGGAVPPRTVDIGFGYSDPDLRKGPFIWIRTRSDGRDRYVNIPYAHQGFQAAPCYAGGDYPIALKPKLSTDGACKLMGLLVVDVEKGRLVWEIKPSPGLQDYGRGYNALDKETDLMLTLTADVQAMMLIDLRGYFGKGGK